MRIKPIYTIILDNDNVYQGGTSFSDTKWRQIPKERKIKRIFYSISDTDNLCLSGYDIYAHMVEVTSELNGLNAGRTNFEYVYIMGKKEDKVTVYKISLKEPKQIETKIYNIEDQWIKKINPSIWK